MQLCTRQMKTLDWAIYLILNTSLWFKEEPSILKRGNNIIAFLQIVFKWKKLTNSLLDVSNRRASTLVQSLFQGSHDFGSQEGETLEGAMKAWSSDYSPSVQTDSASVQSWWLPRQPGLCSQIAPSPREGPRLWVRHSPNNGEARNGGSVDWMWSKEDLLVKELL